MNIKQWLMQRYCPEFEAKMPEDEPGKFRAEAIITYGYWEQLAGLICSWRSALLR